MNRDNTARNIVIGLIDGLTIPFALAAGLMAVSKSTTVIAVACIVATIAYAFTMGTSAYLSGKKYEPSPRNLPSALTVACGYVIGGIIVATPFLFLTAPADALKASAVVTIIGLLIAGYYDSKLNGANAIVGSLRVTFIGLVAAAAAYGIASLFL